MPVRTHWDVFDALGEGFVNEAALEDQRAAFRSNAERLQVRGHATAESLAHPCIKAADKLTQSMLLAEYEQFSEGKAASFAYKKGALLLPRVEITHRSILTAKRFRDFIK